MAPQFGPNRFFRSTMKAVAFVLSPIALLGAGAMLAACQPTTTASSPQAAVYAEYAPDNKPLVSGWNTRIFDTREFQEGTSIQLEDKTGVVTLAPGFYHIVASSLVTYFDPKSPETTPMNVNPPAGYARLRYLADVMPAPSGGGAPSQADIDKSNEKAIAMSTADNADTIPALIDTFIKTDQEVKIVLEHQVGDIKGIYLHVNGNGSKWHVFARISIQRL